MLPRMGTPIAPVGRPLATQSTLMLVEPRGLGGTPNGQEILRGEKISYGALSAAVGSGRSILAGMAKKPEPAKPTTWTIYKIATKPFG
jgi:hypothetical protein